MSNGVAISCNGYCTINLSANFTGNKVQQGGAKLSLVI